MGKKILRCTFILTDQSKAKVWNEEINIDYAIFDTNVPELMQTMVKKAIEKTIKDLPKQLPNKK